MLELKLYRGIKARARGYDKYWIKEQISSQQINTYKERKRRIFEYEITETDLNKSNND